MMTTEIPGGPAPLDEQVVLSPEWLTAVLQAKYPGVEVTGTEVTERLETVATKVRFNVEYAHPVEGAPPALCAKGYFNPASQTHLSGTRAEPVFYQELAAKLPIRTPPTEHIGVDPDNGHGLLVMRDLKQAGCTFLDPLVTYGADQVAATLEQMALLHASTMQKPGESGLEHFPPRLGMLAGIMPADVLQELLDDGRADGVPQDTLNGERLINSVHALAALERPTECLVHGDVHTGNIYLLPDGSPGIIDWQVAQTGLWALDLGYHMGAVLDPEIRRASERDLVNGYVEALAKHGGPTIDPDTAWWLYRVHLAYGFFMWGITRKVIRPVIERHTLRLAQAVADHDSFGLLGV